jgi:hypothetical protein
MVGFGGQKLKNYRTCQVRAHIAYEPPKALVFFEYQKVLKEYFSFYLYSNR